jgi:GH15 family glucan-1,4-alpha-glucosidase
VEDGRLALQCIRSREVQPDIWSEQRIQAHLEDTIAAWRSWSALHQHYDGPWRDVVLHSGRVLQALTLRPTGAIVAAPTTSLPESFGGEPNWDYGYTWVRDTRSVAGRRVSGRNRPVHVGNGAWNQRQLDVYGELLGTDFLKLVCWAALDCAISLAPQLQADDKVDDWMATRDEIRQAILIHGWSERAGAFTQAVGSNDLDASALMMPIVGFLEGTDPGLRARIDAIGDRLTDARGLVYRSLT